MEIIKPNPLKRDVAHMAAWRDHLSERFFAEIDFARRLAKLEGAAAEGWDDLIARAEKAFADALAEHGLDRLEEALTEAEGILAPIGEAAKQHTIHCIGHGHIDMNWMWSWPETVAVTNDTFLTVLRLMDEFPTFRYSQSQASVYDIALRYSPEVFGKIKERVKEGRWEVTASHWVEGDKNLASGESLTRHLLYTRRFMQEHLGLSPEDVAIDWEPDTFGHAWTIPTIDAEGGVRRYYLCRPGEGERPAVFWWQGPDGARVLVNRETTWYNSEIAPASVDALLAFRERTGLKDWMQVYGVGDHGGGPTRRDIRRALDMDTWPIFPNFRFATTKEYYRILEAEGDRWPVLDTELNYEFTGCYTSQSAIKRNNRHGENACSEAEVAAVLALRALGRAYPAGDLREAWTEVLFSHFHDILPGSGVPATRTFNQGTFQRILATTSMVKTHSLRALAAAVDTSFADGEKGPEVAPELEPMTLGAGAGRGSADGGITDAAHLVDGPRPVVVFNPIATPRAEVVKVSVWDAQTGLNPGDVRHKSFIVRDAAGNVVPAQRLGTGDYWGHRYVDLAFPAEVGPLGHTAYIIEEGDVEGYEPHAFSRVAMEGGQGVNVRGGDFVLENEYLKVGFDKSTGGIVQFLDKRTGSDLADPAQPMGLLEFVRERPQNGSAWIIGDTAECECPLPVEAFSIRAGGDWSIDPGRNAPHVASVTAQVHVRDSRFAVTFQLKAGQPWLEITVAGRWVERGGPEVGTPSLRILFPAHLSDVRARYEIPFGSITRDEPANREVPALRWADVSGRIAGTDQAAGLTLLNDSKYGHSLSDATLRLTLIRATYNPDPLPEIGEHTVRLALAPHDGAATVADLTHLGAALNHPLQPVNTDVHAGELPAKLDAGATCDATNVILSHVKRAEDSDALVFRLYETEGRAARATVMLDATLFGKVAGAVSVDLLERPLAENAAAVAGNGFTVDLPAHALASVRIAFKG